MAPNTVALTVDDARLERELVVPPAASAIVLFVPGDGLAARAGRRTSRALSAVCDL